MEILVYIPCHTDFAQAISQVKRIRTDFEFYRQTIGEEKVTLEIILSVNAYSPSDSEIEIMKSICDRVILNGIGVLRDINIANGFLVALDRKPDIFRMVSANDDLVEGALTRILNEFTQDPLLDLLVAGGGERGPFIEKQIIDPPSSKLYYGLITGVIYNLHRISPYLHNGPFLAWTGWSQLAVIQSAMDGCDGLKVKSVPHNKIFVEGSRDLETIREFGYSIYGMLIFGSILKSSTKARKKFIKHYVYHNFYIWHMYFRNLDYDGQIISNNNYLGWNQQIAESLMWRSSKISYIFYQIVKKIPFRKIRRFQRTITLYFSRKSPTSQSKKL